MKNQLKTVLLLGALSAVLVGFGGLLGEGFLVAALVLAVVLNVGAYFYSDRVVLTMHRARELPPNRARHIHAMVEDLARRAGIPKPRVFVIQDRQPNAFATGRNPERGVVAMTTGILDVLTERELRGVLAHEIAHIKNRDILVASVAATIAAAVTYIGHLLMFMPFLAADDDDEGGSILGALAMAILAPLGATLIQLGISRSREYLADEEGARISRDPEALASALRKLELGARRIPSHAEPATASLFIVNPFAGLRRGFSRWFSTHPATEERIARLLAMAGRAPAPRSRIHYGHA